MQEKSDETRANRSPSGLLIWNFVVFVPVVLLANGAVNNGGIGSTINIFLLMAIAPTALVLIGIDIYVLIKRFGKKR